METAMALAGLTFFVLLTTGGWVKKHGWAALKWPLRTIVVIGDLGMITLTVIFFLQ